MNFQWTRGRVLWVAVMATAALAGAFGVYREFGLSWATLIVVAVGAGCVVAMVYLWRVADETTKKLDSLQNERRQRQSGTEQP